MRAPVDGASHVAGTLIELGSEMCLELSAIATFLHLLNPVCIRLYQKHPFRQP